MTMTVDQLLLAISDARTTLEHSKNNVIDRLLDAELSGQVCIDNLTSTAQIFNEAVFKAIAILTLTAIRPDAWAVEIRRDDGSWYPTATIYWDRELEDAKMHRDSMSADDGPDARLVPLYRGK